LIKGFLKKDEVVSVIFILVAMKRVARYGLATNCRGVVVSMRLFHWLSLTCIKEVSDRPKMWGSSSSPYKGWQRL
jgi:hypothetical protein